MGEAIDNTAESIRRHYRLAFMVITAVAAFFLAEPMGTFTFDASWFYWFCAMVALFVGTLMWSEERYKTRQFVGPNHHASFKAPIYQVGEYSIIPIGSIDADYVSWEGGQGTHIVLTVTLTENAGHLHTRARPREVKLEELPEDIQEFIASKRSCGPPYFYASADPEPLDDPLGELCENIAKKLGGVTDGDEVYKKIDEGLKDIRKKYKIVVFAQSGYIKRLHANLTASSNLLAQLTQDGGAIMDFVGQVNRTLNKKSVIDRLTGKEKKEEGGE